MGTFFTYLYYRTESIVVAIIAHAVNNLIPTFGPYLQMKIPLFFIEFNTPWRYLEFAIAIGLLLWSLRRIHQITRPQELELPLEGS
jgi:membrane protease YdiL (CAAX protease family)